MWHFMLMILITFWFYFYVQFIRYYYISHFHNFSKELFNENTQIHKSILNIYVRSKHFVKSCVSIFKNCIFSLFILLECFFDDTYYQISILKFFNILQNLKSFLYKGNRSFIVTYKNFIHLIYCHNHVIIRIP